MFVPGLIERKRDGGALSREEWRSLLAGYAGGDVPDYQMAAMLMACFLRGLDSDETAALLDGMLGSGQGLDLADLGVPVLDKHSTGGVGDKVSLVLAPLVASCGAAVPMMSGRGLGHTGGTLDKLESIPGFRTDLTLAQARSQVERIGCAMLGQTPEIAPVDKKLYALRDVTATVECIPLIAASIMSKKLAEGLTGLVLDVKLGSGAFIPDQDRSRELARTMIALGRERGCPTAALLTAMDRPLGEACGNALEVRESLEALRGGGPDDLREVTLELATEMLLLAGRASRESARAELEEKLDGGAAASRFAEIVEAQGGRAEVVDDPAVLPRAAVVEDHVAGRSGTVLAVEPRAVGRAVVMMGGGRRKVDDVVDPGVGFVITARPGDEVKAGDAVAVIHATTRDGLAIGRAALDEAIRIGDGAADTLPLVVERIGGD